MYKRQDKGWQPAFPYQGNTKGGILRTVFQTAYKSDAGLSAESYGRWTTNSYCCLLYTSSALLALRRAASGLGASGDSRSR